MSIMNMPPPPYLRRIPRLDVDALRPAFTEPGVWDNVDPAFITLCSPDPQAFRPPAEKLNVLQVRLATNFKAARFASDAHTAMLRTLQADIEAIRFDAGGATPIELPVKLKVHDSICTSSAEPFTGSRTIAPSLLKSSASAGRHTISTRCPASTSLVASSDP
jgi:hypothetical protein